MSGWKDPHHYVRADRIDPRTDSYNGRDVLGVYVTRDTATVSLRVTYAPIGTEPITDDITFPRDKIVGVIRAARPSRRQRGRGWRRVFGVGAFTSVVILSACSFVPARTTGGAPSTHSQAQCPVGGAPFGWQTCRLPAGAHIPPLLDGTLPNVAHGAPSEICRFTEGLLVLPAGYAEETSGECAP